MKWWLALLVCCWMGQAAAQKEEIFPEPLEIHKADGIREIIWKDQLSNSKMVRVSFVEKGNLKKEIFYSYKPIFNKDIIDGTYTYLYQNTSLPVERFYTNSNQDTARTLYKQQNSQLTKRENWSLERNAKLRKGAPKYGIGEPAGCIPAEEDLIWSSKWKKKLTNNYKFTNGKLVEKTLGNGDKMLFAYQQNKLVNQKQIGKNNRVYWEMDYEYGEKKIKTTKKYFTAYYGKIPSTEIWTIYLDENKKEYKVEKQIEGSNQVEVLEKFYNQDGNIVRLLKKSNETVLMDYLILYN